MARESGAPNRLASETSLYLRQHADNPVDWYPWGEEARARARETDRPILLSIGYSACHWCHVMERESFVEPETARLMNEGFINVKVDREERPDVDSVYMRAVQALTGRGGWPLTVFLTPGGQPFYGGTYFPPEARHGMPSFRQVLAATRSAWEDRRHDVLSAAEQILDVLARSNAGSDVAPDPGPDDPESGDFDPALPGRALRTLLRKLDRRNGGFGDAPKFPQAPVLAFLLQQSALSGDERALEAATMTLRKMARGGIRDQLGGAFHRYSVDSRWLVPHFEQMLYDNALLADAYLRAFQLTADTEFERVCRDVLDHILDDFQSDEGGFYAARDADSEGEEGRFFVWDRSEVESLLSGEEGRIFCRCYDVSEEGNFEGRNILHLPHDLDAIAHSEGILLEHLEAQLKRNREALKAQRARRVWPNRDEKIVAAWNALTIRSLAEAGAALNEPRYLSAASRAATRLLGALRPEDVLLHQVPLAAARIPGFLEDVAGLGNAYLSLHEATLEASWLRAAVELDAEVERRFRDPVGGLLYDAPSDGERLVIRPREVMDSPSPSGTALASELRLRLGRLLGDEDRIQEARQLVVREAPSMEAYPTGFGRLLAVAGRLVTPPVEVAVVGDPADPATQALLREAHRPFVPTRVVTGTDPNGAEPAASLGQVNASPLLSGRGLVSGRPAAYICRDFVCGIPVTEPGEVAVQLRDAASIPS